MKQLKFTPELCEQILSGEKTSTWRLFDDKELSEGDKLELLNKESGIVIGRAVIDAIKIRTLGTLEEADWNGHERYDSKEEMYETYRTYYGNVVGPDTELKIIHFNFIQN